MLQVAVAAAVAVVVRVRRARAKLSLAPAVGSGAGAASTLVLTMQSNPLYSPSAAVIDGPVMEANPLYESSDAAKQQQQQHTTPQRAQQPTQRRQLWAAPVEYAVPAASGPGSDVVMESNAVYAGVDSARCGVQPRERRGQRLHQRGPVVDGPGGELRHSTSA